jgi:nucleotide-binding universal stress UspA family protein
VLTGDAGSQLAEVSGDFDLMVTGSRAYGPLRRTLLGSTTRKLIRASACPVLVLPRGLGVDPLGLRASGVSTRDRVPIAAE